MEAQLHHSLRCRRPLLLLRDALASSGPPSSLGKFLIAGDHHYRKFLYFIYLFILFTENYDIEKQPSEDAQMNFERTLHRSHTLNSSQTRPYRTAAFVIENISNSERERLQPEFFEINHAQIQPKFLERDNSAVLLLRLNEEICN